MDIDTNIRKNLFKRFHKEFASKRLKYLVHKISYDKTHDASYFGSFAFQVQPYPGDIDLIDSRTLKNKINENTAAENFSKRVTDIIIKMHNTPGVYIGDIKAGVDLFFYFIFLDLRLVNKNDELTKKAKDTMIDDVSYLYYENYLVSTEDYDELIRILKLPKVGNNERSQIYKIIRKYFIIRWTYDEVVRGYKELPGNRKLTFKEAILFPTLVKLDTWSLIDGFYKELTDIYILNFTTTGDDKRFFGKKSDQFILEIKYALRDLVSDGKDFFKISKRLFTLAYLYNDKDTGFIISKYIFHTEFGILSQMSSYLHVLTLMLSTLLNPPYNKISNELQQIKNIISRISEIDIDYKYIYQMLDTIIDFIKKRDNEKSIQNLDILINYFKKTSSDYAKYILEKYHLLPINEKYAPDNDKPSFVTFIDDALKSTIEAAKDIYLNESLIDEY